MTNLKQLTSIVICANCAGEGAGCENCGGTGRMKQTLFTSVKLEKLDMILVAPIPTDTVNLEELEELTIKKVIAQNPHAKLSTIAYMLGLVERTLYRKLIKYNIHKPRAKTMKGHEYE